MVVGIVFLKDNIWQDGLMLDWNRVNYNETDQIDQKTVTLRSDYMISGIMTRFNTPGMWKRIMISICNRHWIISEMMGWITMKFGANIYVTHRINPYDFDDRLDFHPAPTAGQRCHLSSEIAPHLPGGLVYFFIFFLQTFMVLGWCIYSNDFGDLLTFHVPPAVWHLWMKILDGLLWNLAQTFMFPQTMNCSRRLLRRQTT